jgi:hypothetical protein
MSLPPPTGCGFTGQMAMSRVKSFSYEINKGVAGVVAWGLISVTSMLLIAAYLTTPNRVAEPVVAPVWLILGPMIFLAMFAGSLHFIIERRPRIIVDDQGITDFRFSDDRIPWSAVTSWYVHYARNMRSHLVLQIDPDSLWYREHQAAVFSDRGRLARFAPARRFSTFPPAPPRIYLPLIGLAKTCLISEVSARLSPRASDSVPAA